MAGLPIPSQVGFCNSCKQNRAFLHGGVTHVLLSEFYTDF